jgi:hypothetical protein
MKKFYFYVMVVVCLVCTMHVHAQTRYWVGATSGAPGNWNDASNWSATSGGGGGATVPNAAGFDVVFNQGALVNVDIASFSLNTITVTNSSTATLVANAAATITVVSTSNVNQGLRINTGSRLEDSVSANVPFSITFGSGATGWVDGTWYFSGISGVTFPNGPTFTLPGSTGLGNRIDINGTIVYKENMRTPTTGGGVGAEYLFFNNNSVLWFDRNGLDATIPHANWDANATLLFTGITDAVPPINTASGEIGNLVFNCPNVSLAEINLGLTILTTKGNLQVLNTNGRDLVLAAAAGTPNITVQGNFDISGNSIVYQGNSSTRSYILTVNGNFNLSGGSFLMQKSNAVTTTTTTFGVKGNFNHTGGTFGCSSTATSTTTELFVVELSGTSNQNISSSTGTIDNAANMVTLRMNNAAGATLLTPLSVGKISWNSANKGILTTTSTNYIAINNPATDATVVNGPASNGFVSGPVRRATNAATAYVLPTGKGSSYRYAEVIPNTTTASTYVAEYFGTSYSDVSVAYPLLRVSHTEYWSVDRIGGSDAVVRLNLAGALPGSGAADTLMVARYNGVDWARTAPNGGTYLVPGNATNGTIATALITSFTTTPLFTIGSGNADIPLPIVLVSFDAKKLSGNAARVIWSITTNSTPEQFEVLRSADGKDFSSIGVVNGVDQQLAYEFTDNSLPVGISYYRLRMIDKDGTGKLSKIIAVSNGVKGILLTTMMPTVVIDRARINVSASEKGTIQFVVTDMQGRIVKQQRSGIQSGNQEIWLNLSSLSAGAYQVTGYVDGQRSSTIRFIKQ